MVHVSVDPHLPENQDLKPELEESEFIEVFLVPLRSPWDECKKLEAEGYAIDARVATLAEGIDRAGPAIQVLMAATPRGSIVSLP